MGKRIIQNHSPGKSERDREGKKWTTGFTQEVVETGETRNNSFTHLTPEDGCEVQQPKRSDIPSQQDEDKSPKIPLQKTTIPSSKNLGKKLV